MQVLLERRESLHTSR